MGFCGSHLVRPFSRMRRTTLGISNFSRDMGFSARSLPGFGNDRSKPKIISTEIYEYQGSVLFKETEQKSEK